MKIDKKKRIVIVCIFILCILFMSQVQAFNPYHYRPSSENSVSGAMRMEEIGNTIVGFIQVIGSAISVISLVVIGIKYVMGSVEEKAEYKQTLKPYLIGAIMLFGITNILAIIENVVTAF